MFCTLAVFPLSLEKEHVRVDGPLLYVLLHSLDKTNTCIRSKTSQNMTCYEYVGSKHTHHFRISPVDDDAHAIGRGGHETGGAR